MTRNKGMMSDVRKGFLLGMFFFWALSFGFPVYADEWEELNKNIGKLHKSQETSKAIEVGLQALQLAEETFDHVLVTPTIQYVGKREDNDSALEVDAYTLVHLNIIYRLTDSLRLSISANNLFDEEYTDPE